MHNAAGIELITGIELIKGGVRTDALGQAIVVDGGQYRIG
jgi:hypothetical protein